MKAVKFADKITINTDATSVFDYTQDYTQRLRWDTFLKSAVLCEGVSRAEKGAKAYCVGRNGLGMETVYVSFNRPDVAVIAMTKGPFIFKSFAGSWRFRALSATQTEVTFLYSFTLRLLFTPCNAFLKRYLQKEVRQRLADLKAGVEKISNIKSEFSI